MVCWKSSCGGIKPSRLVAPAHLAGKKDVDVPKVTVWSGSDGEHVEALHGCAAPWCPDHHGCARFSHALKVDLSGNVDQYIDEVAPKISCPVYQSCSLTTHLFRYMLPHDVQHSALSQ